MNYIPSTPKISTKIFNTSEEASIFIATKIADLIIEKAKQNLPCVLGLSAGSSPLSVYKELVKKHKQGLSFSNVHSFNLDEYYPMYPQSEQSFSRFMHEHLFDFIDIPKENIHIPDGTIEYKNIGKYCTKFEDEINKLGGIDIQLLGIGRSGHIGFNEPGSNEYSSTRLVTLNQITRIDASNDFSGEENVPKQAITMGIGTILKAKQIIIMAWGNGKASVVNKAIEGNMTDKIPASFLQKHPKSVFVLDKAASSELALVQSPWLSGQCEWTDKLLKKAVIWLSQKTKKPILKLMDIDYMEHCMQDVLTKYESAYSINLKIFNQLQRTITGWPGGKPNTNDDFRPVKSKPFPKRILIFSPHPDDDVISMGGTLIRLVDQGHDVHVAYQTSGNIAVFDEEVIRYSNFVRDYNKVFDINNNEADKIHKKIFSNEKDIHEFAIIKEIIRKGEAESACRYIGIPHDNIHFLKMPFYETGKPKKNPLNVQDIKILIDIIKKIQPHQIYAAGDLLDPHGTHRICLNAILKALKKLEKEPFLKKCYVWLYRGAWQEWPIEEIDMAVPISPGELMRKRKAIFKHQSQKDTAPFPGSDNREFWVRSEDRNRYTAEAYNQLGLPEYEALEAFVRFDFANQKYDKINL